MDFFCINEAACDLVDTGSIHDALTTIPPWFRATATDPRAGTYHSTIFLTMATRHNPKRHV